MISIEKRKEIYEALNRIQGHELFKRSSTYSSLLTYLVEKALVGEDLKEYTIGTDLFGENYENDKNYGTVRSKMYKLREKLSKYYENDGKKELLIFDIKKGQYNLTFLSADTYFESKPRKGENLIIPIKHLKIALALLLIAVFSFFIVRTLITKPTFIWEAYFEKKAENLLIISDQFIVYEKMKDGKMYGVSYPEINNYKDLIQYTQEHPNKDLKITDYTLMSKMAPYTVKTLSKWFDFNDNDFHLQLESKLKYEDLQKYNTIFIGQYKTMNLSKSLFLKDSKVFSTFKDGFKYKTDSIEKLYNTKFGTNLNVEYAMVSYNTSESGHSALYFVSNNDIGVLATVRKFTSKIWLSEFQKQLQGTTKHFNALFEVRGIERNDFNCKLMELEVLN
ncbi:hypothetical protein [Flavicella sediminum]|uniref:hypothetical protein n=1 Tax=Flavicella sediminum TaxID=2585141 RepID=UPI00111EE92D|nr:hypothetical protein [Flavicella sediminum]